MPPYRLIVGGFFADYAFLAQLAWGSLALVTFGFMLVLIRVRWLGFSRRLAQKAGAASSLERPGLIQSRLGSGCWGDAFRTAIHQAAQSFGSSEHPAGRELATALNGLRPSEAALSALTRDAASEALTSGSLQSTIARVGTHFVYALVFPARHEHNGQCNRHEGFAWGWATHISHMRQTALAEAPSRPAVCLLLFLDPLARHGTMLVAYDGPAGRVIPTGLEAGPGHGQELRTTEQFDFSLA
jgi:hypothetical protein